MVVIEGTPPPTVGDYIGFKCEEYATLHTHRARFIGYNTIKGSRMYGTLENVLPCRCIETPVCENLMTGMACGMALDGMRPVVCFERHDFLLIGLDALVNHIDKMPWLSGSQYKLPVIVRAIVGSREPLNPGPQHTADYTASLALMLKHTPVVSPKTVEDYDDAWSMVGKTSSGAIVIIEYKDQYDKEIKNRRKYGN